MKTCKAELAAAARIALDTVKWCEENCPNDAERLNAAHTEFQKHAKAYSNFQETEFKMKAIQELKDKIEGLRQDLALGVISKSEYGIERGKLLAQIEVLDTRPNCTFSKEPAPDDSKLKAAKDRCYDRIKPYFQRIKSKDLTDLQVALSFCTTTQEVAALYRDWQSKLSLKNIANLPDFKAAA